jgi:altered-inheritance-of-mitochondria protein 13
VQKEIAALKERLEKRKLREEVADDQGVEKAKKQLVSCLRLHDRRPLDCWKEVQAFKDEVGRLERGFVERVLD